MKRKLMLVLLPLLLLAACEDEHVINVPSHSHGGPVVAECDTVVIEIKCVKWKRHGRWHERCDTTVTR